MEAVSPYALFRKIVGQGESAFHRRHSVMKRGIKAGDLDQIRFEPPNGRDPIEIEGLMQRRERDKRLQTFVHYVVDDHRFEEQRTAVNDTMANGREVEFSSMSVEPIEQLRKRVLVSGSLHRFICQGGTARVSHKAPSRCPDPIDFTA